jgi:spermidine/putrescine transport system permease protein
MSASPRSWPAEPAAGAVGRQAWPWLLLAPGLSWLLLLFALPLLGLVPLSLSERSDRFRLLFRFTGQLTNYREALQEHGGVLLQSFIYTGASTLLALAIGYPLACFIAFRGGRWRGLLTGLVVMPFFTAYLVRTLAWSTLLADRGPVLALLRWLGLVGPLETLGVLQDGRLLNTAAAVVGGLAYNALPFLVLPLVVSLERVGPALLEAAEDLHAGPWMILRRLIWPLSRPGLLAGLTLSVVPSVGDLVNGQYLGGPNNRMLGNAIESLVLVQGQLPRAAALTVLLLLLLGVMVTLALRGRGSGEPLLP